MIYCMGFTKVYLEKIVLVPKACLAKIGNTSCGSVETSMSMH